MSQRPALHRLVDALPAEDLTTARRRLPCSGSECESWQVRFARDDEHRLLAVLRVLPRGKAYRYPTRPPPSASAPGRWTSKAPPPASERDRRRAGSITSVRFWAKGDD